MIPFPSTALVLDLSMIIASQQPDLFLRAIFIYVSRQKVGMDPSSQCL